MQRSNMRNKVSSFPVFRKNDEGVSSTVDASNDIKLTVTDGEDAEVANRLFPIVRLTT